LFLAFIGLFLSAFALLVLQSSMEGLQRSQIQRSKAAFGHADLIFPNVQVKTANEMVEKLNENGVPAHIEYQIELLLKHGEQITPVMAHGVRHGDPVPEFANREEKYEILIPFDIAYKLGIDVGSKIELISPGHIDVFFDEIPRSISLFTSDVMTTRVPEVDQFHVWVQLNSILNLIEARTVNRIIIRDEFDKDTVKSVLGKFNVQYQMKTWEQKNQSLVFALGLETTVMVFLFVAMNFLVSLCIISGLLIFFRKVRVDLSSFWILGSSKEKLEKASWWLVNFLSLGSVGSGIVFGLIFLVLFENFGGDIMPDIFVDRKIPIHINAKGILVSFLIPYFISLFFSWLSIKQFKKDSQYLDIVRTVG
jgi:lipoprotein-releasing system permease protein